MEREPQDRSFKKHYSEKGGHQERSLYWKLLDSLSTAHHMRSAPIVVEAWRIRRQMRRAPFDGKR